MKWFQGTIPEAIQASKSKHSIFVVYIEGDDELSQKMAQTWENPEVTTLCEKEDCVAIKIEANSDVCGFFSQIYPVVVVPSVFFIGENGIPLEVTGGFIDSSDFVKKIESVVQQQGSAPVKPVTKSAPATQAGASEENPPQASSSSAVPSSTDKDVPISASTPHEDSPTDDAKRPKLDLETRVERAKLLMEEKREEKAVKEKDELKNKESERRKLGRDMQQLRQYQEERELKEVQEQMKKDREEERKAREKVKEQIARDRAERAARFNREKEERDRAQDEAKKAKLLAQQQAAAEAEAKRSETARLQFRLPDGSSVTQQFPSGVTLRTVLDFISQHVGSSVTLSTTYPKRTFTDDDVEQTLATLQLAPSAVVIVIPRRRSVNVSSEGGSSGLLTMLLAPLFFLLNFLRSLFSSSSVPAPPSAAGPSSPQTQARGGDRAQSAYQRRSQGGVSRQEGKIHRFSNRDDNDDENATWNGNSTQQM